MPERGATRRILVLPRSFRTIAAHRGIARSLPGCSIAYWTGNQLPGQHQLVHWLRELRDTDSAPYDLPDPACADRLLVRQLPTVVQLLQYTMHSDSKLDNTMLDVHINSCLAEQGRAA